MKKLELLFSISILTATIYAYQIPIPTLTAINRATENYRKQREKLAEQKEKLKKARENYNNLVVFPPYEGVAISTKPIIPEVYTTENGMIQSRHMKALLDYDSGVTEWTTYITDDLDSGEIKFFEDGLEQTKLGEIKILDYYNFPLRGSDRSHSNLFYKAQFIPKEGYGGIETFRFLASTDKHPDKYLADEGFTQADEFLADVYDLMGDVMVPIVRRGYREQHLAYDVEKATRYPTADKQEYKGEYAEGKDPHYTKVIPIEEDKTEGFTIYYVYREPSPGKPFLNAIKTIQTTIAVDEDPAAKNRKLEEFNGKIGEFEEKRIAHFVYSSAYKQENEKGEKQHRSDTKYIFYVGQREDENNKEIPKDVITIHGN